MHREIQHSAIELESPNLGRRKFLKLLATGLVGAVLKDMVSPKMSQAQLPTESLETPTPDIMQIVDPEKVEETYRWFKKNYRPNWSTKSFEQHSAEIKCPVIFIDLNTRSLNGGTGQILLWNEGKFSPPIRAGGGNRYGNAYTNSKVQMGDGTTRGATDEEKRFRRAIGRTPIGVFRVTQMQKHAKLKLEGGTHNTPYLIGFTEVGQYATLVFL